jgi:hypothetical protein
MTDPATSPMTAIRSTNVVRMRGSRPLRGTSAAALNRGPRMVVRGGAMSAAGSSHASLPGSKTSAGSSSATSTIQNISRTSLSLVVALSCSVGNYEIACSGVP